MLLNISRQRLVNYLLMNLHNICEISASECVRKESNTLAAPKYGQREIDKLNAFEHAQREPGEFIVSAW